MQLSHAQAKRFGHILNSLVLFVNDARHIVPEDELFDGTGQMSLAAYEQILPIVWDVPTLIDEFVRKNPHNLDRADLDEAATWKDRLTGFELLLGYDEAGRALFSIGDDIAAVCGIQLPCDVEFGIADLPMPVCITLLPFDGLVASKGSSLFGTGLRGPAGSCTVAREMR